LVQELYGIGSWEASNRNANKWKTLWRTFFGPESWNQKAQKTNRLLHQEFLKEKFSANKKAEKAKSIESFWRPSPATLAEFVENARSSNTKANYQLPIASIK